MFHPLGALPFGLALNSVDLSINESLNFFFLLRHIATALVHVFMISKQQSAATPLSLFSL